MRPRLIAAENFAAAAALGGTEPASMRPRLIAAENGENYGLTTMRDVASMRPRLIAAENRLRKSCSIATARLQ